MILLAINGLEEGEYPFEIESPTEKIQGLSPEFHGTIRVAGTVRKYGNHYTIDALATGKATLICDLSLEEYTEEIQAPIHKVFMTDSHNHPRKNDDDSLLIIREDDKYIDLTDEVQQEIAVQLPMKRVSPKYREKSFSELHPEHSLEGNPSDALPNEQWAALKKISFDSHN